MRPQRSGQPVHLVDHDDLDPLQRNVNHQPLQARPLDGAAREPAVVVASAGLPALTLLADDEGLARFALGIQRVEALLEPFLGGLACVDGAGQGVQFFSPKNAGPDHGVPVMERAIAVRLRQTWPSYSKPLWMTVT